MKDFLYYLYNGDFPKAMAAFSSVALRIVLAFLLWWLGRKLIRRIAAVILAQLSTVLKGTARLKGKKTV